MGFVEAIRSGFSNYVNFSSRAPRSEYWYWTLFAILVGIAANILDTIIFYNIFSPVSTLTALALFLPGLAVSVRRLHDIDRTGWWLLIAFTIIGLFVLLYWDCVKGTAGSNRFGTDPLGGG
jgi:uncharacterized membrane protein YhaH (DUF805 family)